MRPFPTLHSALFYQVRAWVAKRGSSLGVLNDQRRVPSPRWSGTGALFLQLTQIPIPISNVGLELEVGWVVLGLWVLRP